MRRGHTTADYLRRIETIKNAPRRIAITSDIIVGFPGETEQDFRDTMSLVENVKYDGLYIFNTLSGRERRQRSCPTMSAKGGKRSRFLELEELQQRQQKAIYEKLHWARGRRARRIREREIGSGFHRTHFVS
jgi:tRNA-2-methylthio-N6-dimethylallyladenosine synthase